MRFVAITSAKLKIDEHVYTLNDAGVYSTGKLVARQENASGSVLTFEVPQYFNDKAPAIKPFTVTNITHVARMKAGVKEVNSAKELQEALK